MRATFIEKLRRHRKAQSRSASDGPVVYLNRSTQVSAFVFGLINVEKKLFS